MEDNIFLLSDASYDYESKSAGLGVIDTFTQKKYQLNIDNINNSSCAEYYALALSVKIAIKNRYSNVVFVYDNKNLEIKSLKEYANKRINNVQFLWLKRAYLKEADSLAKNAKKIVKNLNIKKASDDDLKNIATNNILEKKKNHFMSFSNDKKITLAIKIANEREKEILNAFLNSKSIKHYSKNSLGSKKAKFMKFVYLMLTGEDKTNFFTHLKYISRKINEKDFKKGLDNKTIDWYIDKIKIKL